MHAAPATLPPHSEGLAKHCPLSGLQERSEKQGVCTAAELCARDPKPRVTQHSPQQNAQLKDKAAPGSACVHRRVSILLKTPCMPAAFAEALAPPLPSMLDLFTDGIDPSHALLQLRTGSGKGGLVTKQGAKRLPSD